ncbi:RNA polymerase sigma factor [Chloroflexota bacterium]
MKTRETDNSKPLDNEERQDENALTLDTLYEGYRERLLRFVLTKVGGDAVAAEDIVQEAFTAALVSLSGFRSRSSPYTWLCSIAQHKIADHYRSQPPGHGTAELSLDYLADDESQDTTASSIERWMEHRETRDMVRRALHDLPPGYSNVIRYKYFEGLSVNEISFEIGRSPKAVEGLLARARRALSLSLTEAVHA